MEKSEILEQISFLRNKLNEIEEQERLVTNTSLVGKFFKGWYDVSYQYTQYTAITDIDSFGNVSGWYFRIYDSGDIQISNPDKNTIFGDISFGDSEISKKEFYDMWEYIKNQILLS